MIQKYLHKIPQDNISITRKDCVIPEKKNDEAQPMGHRSTPKN